MSPLKRKKKHLKKEIYLMEYVDVYNPSEMNSNFSSLLLFSFILIIFWRGGGGLTTAKRNNFKNRKRQKKNQSIITATIFIF
jgi:hypothetical protein